ncbi:MAG TPA: hypothetical protein DEA97_14275 [Bacteroidales bacterium]|nr:MAG: hypothetical protein UR43_C0011G0022 [candidate division TM6 bacterium GW2011_GWF2_33_332]HBS87725.1 hypothetical protein [Bacteroidales bacterium]
MKVFLENPNLLIKEFNEMAAISQMKAYITVGVEIQKEEIEILNNYRKDLKKIKKAFIKKNMENEANLVYCIDNSLLAVQYEIKMLVNIKEGKMNEAWSNLVDAQGTYRNVLTACPSGLLSQNGYIERLASYEKLLFPKQFFHSVGGIIKKNHCSICKQTFKNCDHIKGKLYKGELCCRIITEIDLEEISLVENPANKHCRVLTIETKGKKTDTMTLREVSD